MPTDPADTGNPWEDHAASFARADMLFRRRRALDRGESLALEDQKTLLSLAIEAHDAMSILGGGEIISFGKLAQAIMDIAGTESDKAQLDPSP